MSACRWNLCTKTGGVYTQLCVCVCVCVCVRVRARALPLRACLLVHVPACLHAWVVIATWQAASRRVRQARRQPQSRTHLKP
jgi:hypothetical protein